MSCLGDDCRGKGVAIFVAVAVYVVVVVGVVFMVMTRSANGSVFSRR